MKPLSLRARLRLGLGAIALIVSILAAAATASLDRLGNAISTILKENYLSVVMCERMQEALERQDSAALFAASGRKDIAVPLLAEQRKTFREALDRERANVTLPGEGALVTKLQEEYGEYQRAIDRVLLLPLDEQSKAYFADLLPRFQSMKQAIQAIAAMNHANMEAADRNAKALARRTVNLAFAVGCLAVLLAAWFAWWLPRSLIGPIDALSRTARTIGEGNLAVDVPHSDVSELAPLSDALRAMIEKLRAYRASSLGELLAAKDLANSTVSCMLDPVVVFGPGGEVLLANEAAEKAFALQPGTIEELRALEVTIPDALAGARDLVLSRKAAVLPQTLSEAMRWGNGDSERHYLVRAAPLRAESEITGAVVVAQDVTRYRRIDELKSDVVATVSHQFKTPLTSLRMATHMLLEPTIGALTPSQLELVTTARNETERLRTMVDELLDLVRIEADAGALQRRPIDPAVLLADVADAHRTVAREKGVTLDVTASDQKMTFDGDPERLSIVLANLVANAIRHTPKGGTVTLAAEHSGASMRLVVRDTGEGIPAREVSRIFERTVSLGDGSGDRHGLGLTIAREIVLHHGGDIAVTSDVGAGSTFVVSLPIASRA